MSPVDVVSTVSLPPLVEPAAELTARRGRPLQPPSRHPRSGCRRAEAAQERARAGDRRRRARRADAAVPGRGRCRHDRHRRRSTSSTSPTCSARSSTASSDIGRSKAQSARDSIAEINPLVEVRLHEVRLEPDNAVDLFEQYDLILDGTDNFATRYLVNDAAVLARQALRLGLDLPLRGPGVGVLGGRARRPRA